MNNRRSFIIGIKSTKLSLREKNFLRKYKPWGVILFTRNIKDIKQAKQLTTSIRKIFNDNKYPILIDQEGGRVQRFHNEFTKIPSMQNISKYAIKYNHLRVFQEIGWLISSELIASGVDLNFSPVLDLDENTSSCLLYTSPSPRDPT